MTEAKHTPGPWALQGNSTVIAPNMPRIKYGKHEEYERAYIVCQPDLYTDPEWGGEEKRANARLIAAAPEMLEALQESVQLFELQSQMHRLVSRRAKGMRGIAVDDDGLAIEWQSLRAIADCMIVRRDKVIAKATGN